jgi:hypothetical protein
LPNKIPAFGLSAVPLPMKNRTMLPGCHPPIADAAGDTTADAAGPISDTAGSAGSPLDVVAAAALATPEPDPSSRRAAANAAHANGAAAGKSPPEPDPSHDNNAEPIEFTDPRGAAVITGTSAGAASTAAAGTGATTDSTTAAGAEIGDTSRAGPPDPPPADGPGTDTAATLDSAETASEGEGAASEEEVSAVTGPPSEFSRRGTTVSAAPTGLWGRTRRPAPSPAADSAAPDPDSPPSADPRPPARGPRAGEDFRDDDDEESAEPDPLDPAEPVVSANAIGSEPRPEPTPRATANAPTRPTCRVLRPADLRIRSGDTRNAPTAATITLMSRNIALSGRHHQQTAPNYGRFTADCVRSAA